MLQARGIGGLGPPTTPAEPRPGSRDPQRLRAAARPAREPPVPPAALCPPRSAPATDTGSSPCRIPASDAFGVSPVAPQRDTAAREPPAGSRVARVGAGSSRPPLPARRTGMARRPHGAATAHCAPRRERAGAGRASPGPRTRPGTEP